ncbi:MAG: hypothetical protein AB1656_04530 [Candidatus Omnitrophota bacterium]
MDEAYRPETTGPPPSDPYRGRTDNNAMLGFDLPSQSINRIYWINKSKTSAIALGVLFDSGFAGRRIAILSRRYRSPLEPHRTIPSTPFRTREKAA